MQTCVVRLPAAGFARPAATLSSAARRRAAGIARIADPEQLEDTVGVANLLERDNSALLAEVKEEAFAAFEDETSEPVISIRAQQAAAQAAAEQQQADVKQKRRGPAAQRADALRDEEGSPKRTREAIALGLEKFQAGEYQAAIDLFQLSLELPGSGLMRMSGSVQEYSCPSDGEENAALYNMACCWAKLGQKESALTVLQALLENDFEYVASIKSDPDLASLKGPELDKLTSKYDGPLAKLFNKKKDESNTKKPWFRW